MALPLLKNGRVSLNICSRFNRTVATLAFDMYGTVFNVNGLAEELRNLPSIGQNKEPAFNSMWRSKQLKYTFRRTCKNRYAQMSNCTAHALEYCCEMFNATLGTKEKENLCSKYTQLPAFPDCKDSLNSLHTAGHRIFAFSNGTRNDISDLLKSAKLTDLFEDVIVVDDMENQVFKPHPNIYQHFNLQLYFSLQM